MNFITKKEFKGSLLKCLESTLDNAANFNDVSAVISPNSWQRKEIVSYPGSSLREAILNAFSHSNYFIRSNIKIEFFDDRVKITNPGGIYQATLEQIMSGVQTYRNPGLVNILSKLHYIENFGTGIPRILQAYEGAEKQPVFNPSGNFFMLTLPNQNYADPVNDPVIDPVNDPVKIKDDRLGDMELIILQTIQQNPGISTRNLLKLIQEKQPEVTLDTLKNNIKRKLQDYIEFRGPQKKAAISSRKETNNRALICREPSYVPILPRFNTR